MRRVIIIPDTTETILEQDLVETRKLLEELPDYTDEQLVRLARNMEIDDDTPGVSITEDEVVVTDRRTFIAFLWERNGETR